MDIRQKALSAYQRVMSGKGASPGESAAGTAAAPGDVPAGRARSASDAGDNKSGASSLPEGLLKASAKEESRVARVARFLVLLGTDEAEIGRAHV